MTIICRPRRRWRIGRRTADDASPAILLAMVTILLLTVAWPTQMRAPTLTPTPNFSVVEAAAHVAGATGAVGRAVPRGGHLHVRPRRRRLEEASKSSKASRKRKKSAAAGPSTSGGVRYHPPSSTGADTHEYDDAGVASPSSPEVEGTPGPTPEYEGPPGADDVEGGRAVDDSDPVEPADGGGEGESTSEWTPPSDDDGGTGTQKTDGGGIVASSEDVPDGSTGDTAIASENDTDEATLRITKSIDVDAAPGEDEPKSGSWRSRKSDMGSKVAFSSAASAGEDEESERSNYSAGGTKSDQSPDREESVESQSMDVPSETPEDGTANAESPETAKTEVDVANGEESTETSADEINDAAAAGSGRAYDVVEGEKEQADGEEPDNFGTIFTIQPTTILLRLKYVSGEMNVEARTVLESLVAVLLQTKFNLARHDDYEVHPRLSVSLSDQWFTEGAVLTNFTIRGEYSISQAMEARTASVSVIDFPSLLQHFFLDNAQELVSFVTDPNLGESFFGNVTDIQYLSSLHATNDSTESDGAKNSSMVITIDDIDVHQPSPFGSAKPTSADLPKENNLGSPAPGSVPSTAPTQYESHSPTNRPSETPTLVPTRYPVAPIPDTTVLLSFSFVWDEMKIPEKLILVALVESFLYENFHMSKHVNFNIINPRFKVVMNEQRIVANDGLLIRRKLLSQDKGMSVVVSFTISGEYSHPHAITATLSTVHIFDFRGLLLEFFGDNTQDLVTHISTNTKNVSYFQEIVKVERLPDWPVTNLSNDSVTGKERFVHLLSPTVVVPCAVGLSLITFAVVFFASRRRGALASQDESGELKPLQSWSDQSLFPDLLPAEKGADSLGPKDASAQPESDSVDRSRFKTSQFGLTSSYDLDEHSSDVWRDSEDIYDNIRPGLQHAGKSHHNIDDGNNRDETQPMQPDEDEMDEQLSYYNMSPTGEVIRVVSENASKDLQSSEAEVGSLSHVDSSPSQLYDKRQTSRTTASATKSLHESFRISSSSQVHVPTDDVFSTLFPKASVASVSDANANHFRSAEKGKGIAMTSRVDGHEANAVEKDYPLDRQKSDPTDECNEINEAARSVSGTDIEEANIDSKSSFSTKLKSEGDGTVEVAIDETEGLSDTREGKTRQEIFASEENQTVSSSFNSIIDGSPGNDGVIENEINEFQRDCYAPPGKIGVRLNNKEGAPVVSGVNVDSPLNGVLFPGDRILAIDDVDTRRLSAYLVTQMMVKKKDKWRKITFQTNG